MSVQSEAERVRLDRIEYGWRYGKGYEHLPALAWENGFYQVRCDIDGEVETSDKKRHVLYFIEKHRKH